MRWARILIAGLALSLSIGANSAHPGNAAVAVVNIDAAGAVKLMLRFDALAFALDDSPDKLGDGARAELIAGTDAAMGQLFADARERFLTLFELSADRARVPIEITGFPTTAEVRSWVREHPERRLLPKLDLSARATLPASTDSVVLRFPAVISDVILTVDHPGEEPIALPLKPGEATPEIHLRLARPTMGTLEVLFRYIELGFTHIVPRGVDHVLFVLGLYLLSTSLRALLLQVTAFTVAHSITLALTMLGFVELSPRVVEPIIAASIAFVAIENVITSRVHAWRVALVFVFGLIHGMGFAGVLRELGLPPGQMANALVSFNVGVELGQLTVIAGAFALVGWWRKRAWYRKAIVIPVSLAIAAIGVLWTIQRLG